MLRMRSFLGLVALVTSCLLAQAAYAQGAREVVAKAATALGGADKVQAVRNITLSGYAQYAYMLGGGKLTADPEAPDKWTAANELSRAYDLEHGRFQMKERRNMLFPFLAPFGHSFAPLNQILDGDVAFDLAPDGRATRIARFIESPQQIDGVHMRRMYMLNNPVVLLRSMMDPATRLSTPRREGGRTVVDITLKEGDRLSAGFEPDGLPAFVRWRNPQQDLGEVTLTTYYTGWSVWDGQGGLLLPFGYNTRFDWRGTVYFKMYVDAYKLNTDIGDLAAPAATRAAPEPASFPSQPVSSVPIGKGVWRVNQGGATVVEFKDHITLFELGTSREQAKAVIAHARTLAPGKPVTQLVVSHNHFDHAAGVREAVAAGLTIISRRGSERVFREMATQPAVEFKDTQGVAPKPFKFIPVDEHLDLSDETQTLHVYWGRNNGHMSDVVFGYMPALKLMMEGDIVSAAYDWQHWPDTFRDVIAYYKLDVERVSPVHSVSRDLPPILTKAQAEELLAGGTKRAREHCADQQSKGNFWPGCPIQSKYY